MGGDLGEFTCGKRWASVGVFDTRHVRLNSLRSTAFVEPTGSVAGFKGLRPPAADPQQNEGMMLRGYENHEAIALVTCAS